MITYKEFLEGDVVLEKGIHMTRGDYYKRHCPNSDPMDLYIFIAKCIRDNPDVHDSKPKSQLPDFSYDI